MTTPSIVQKTGIAKCNGAKTVSVVFSVAATGADITAGNAIVCGRGGTESTPTESWGRSTDVDGSMTYGIRSASGARGSDVWYQLDCTGGATTVTGTTNYDRTYYIQAFEVQDADEYDAVEARTRSANPHYAADVAAFSPATESISICFFGHNTDKYSTPSTGWTEEGDNKYIYTMSREFPSGASGELCEKNSASSTTDGYGVVLSLKAAAAASSDVFFGNKTDQISCGEKAQTAAQLNGVLIT